MVPQGSLQGAVHVACARHSTMTVNTIWLECYLVEIEAETRKKILNTQSGSEDAEFQGHHINQAYYF